MSNWQLVGPKVPRRVWSSHLLVARGFDDKIRWQRLAARDVQLLSQQGASPCLLVIHGTGLRTRSGVAGLTKHDYETLRAQYGARILAFEHRAISQRLHQNARDLLRQLAVLGPLRLHVLGISRGGLVARLFSEGWMQPSLNIEKLLFLGTPNEGAASARRDPSNAKKMRMWRTDVRRLALMQHPSKAGVELHQDPYKVPGHSQADMAYRAWPFLVGTKDQLPKSRWLQRLNGFCGPAPFAGQPGDCRYYAIASMFNFEHGALNPQVMPGCRREDICEHVFDGVPNDLVVPTAGVYQPSQGPNACGRFPLPASRLRVFLPSCNITHVGMLRHQAVRTQILTWLHET